MTNKLQDIVTAEIQGLKKELQTTPADGQLSIPNRTVSTIIEWIETLELEIEVATKQYTDYIAQLESAQTEDTQRLHEALLRDIKQRLPNSPQFRAYERGATCPTEAAGALLDAIQRIGPPIQFNPHATICTKCYHTVAEKTQKYCGDGSDKDNSHRFVKLETPEGQAAKAKRPPHWQQIPTFNPPRPSTPNTLDYLLGDQ